MTDNWQENDVFQWSYKVMPDPKSYELSYWCCSQVGIVKDGCLCDTYWMIVVSDGYMRFSNGRVFSESDQTRLNLKFLGNLNDFERRGDYAKLFYDDADVMDLNHSNSPRGNVYIRKGAEKSRAKMIEVAREKLAEAEARLSSAQYAVDRQKWQIDAMERGEDLNAISF